MSTENISLEVLELQSQVRKRNRKRINNRRISLLSLIIISFIVITFSNSYAKYVKRVEVDATIEDGFIAKYNMEVISDDGTQVKLREKLSFESINPGEFQVIPFVVRNAEKKGNDYIISDVDMVYSIELYHTQNLPLTYELYQYTGVDRNGNPKYELMTDYIVTDTNNTSEYYNYGEIYTYKDDIDNKTLELKAKPGEVSQHRYKLVITWENEGKIQIDNKYVHEVDMIYLVVNGAQKE